MNHRIILSIVLMTLLLAPAAMATELVKNGDFEGVKNGAALRRDDNGQDWYESRKDKDGRELLIMSTKKVGGNKTKKAMIKAHPELNTYLSQRLSASQTGMLTVKYDIYLKYIRPEYNRSGFFFAGKSSDKKNGPNSTGKERFAFVAFEHSDDGKVQLFVREGKKSWDDRTVLVTGLELKEWYTVTVVMDIAAATYTVQLDDGAVSAPLEAFRTSKKKAPTKISHLSFASWNDGAGSFFIDNVSAIAE